MPLWMVQNIIKNLRKKFYLKNKVLIVGVAYKKNG